MIEKTVEKIENLLREKDCIIIGIDGRCGAGKTTLAKNLSQIFDCNVFHMDDFFLRDEQRTEERLETPGENVDHERFFEEVIRPLLKRENFSYMKYDCKKRGFSERVFVNVKKINIIEGSYSCRDDLAKYYDLKIFLDIDGEKQLKRIEKRNGKEALKVFQTKWIPLEEMYFETFAVKDKCDIYLKSEKD